MQLLALLLRLPLAAHKTWPSLTLLFSVKASNSCAALPCVVLLRRVALVAADFYFVHIITLPSSLWITKIQLSSIFHKHTYTHIHTYKSAWANSFGWHFKHFATHICNTFWWPFSNSCASNFPLPLPLPLLHLFFPLPLPLSCLLNLFPGQQLLLPEIRFLRGVSCRVPLPVTHNFFKTLPLLSSP